ncbi:AzlD domain-containing protein [Ottowia sp. SB7-C50]|uniref:AzlD domain-containing protein n=1 Tax=Ottowia sp. SB7-C50 TaxID=3081231 RepID=UPI00295530AB|nr:AzlD domain-containing protein [Ottowia sp. SB7-C50]WOP15682.1 AzlD domain-containing protein [Ottowia sp. SB7-C50]
MRETDGWTLLVIVGMTVVTVLTRCFFFISEREWRLPDWAQRGLQYAPIAALAAVIAPDLLLTQGVFGNLLRDARTWGALAGAAFYFWRSRWRFALVGAIAVGMAVYLPLRILLNW